MSLPPDRTAVTNISDLVIGAGSRICLGKWAFKGLLDNVRIWGSRTDASGYLAQDQILYVFQQDDKPPAPLVELTFEDGLRNSGTLGGTGQFVTNNGAAPCLSGPGAGFSATRAMDNTSVPAMGGDGGYLRLADNDALDGLQSLSIALWYKPEADLAEFTRLVAKRRYWSGFELFHGSGGDERLGLYAGDDNGAWRWANSGDQPVYSGDGRWVFAAGAWDLASGRMDIYGSLEHGELLQASGTVATPPVGTAATNSANLIVGAASGTGLGQNAFKGLIDNVRIWGSRDDDSGFLTVWDICKLLNHDTLKPAYNPADKPLVELCFDNSRENSGVLGGAARFVANNGLTPAFTPDAYGVSLLEGDGALDLYMNTMGAPGGYACFFDSPYLDGLESLTVMAWYCTTQPLAGFPRLAGKRNGYRGYEVYFQSTNRLGLFVGDDRNRSTEPLSFDVLLQTSPLFVSSNTWVCVAQTYDGGTGTARFYAGRAGQRELTFLGTLSAAHCAGIPYTNSSDLVIGAGSSHILGEYAFAGLIDNVRVWGAADGPEGALAHEALNDWFAGDQWLPYPGTVDGQPFCRDWAVFGVPAGQVVVSMDSAGGCTVDAEWPGINDALSAPLKVALDGQVNGSFWSEVGILEMTNDHVTLLGVTHDGIDIRQEISVDADTVTYAYRASDSITVNGAFPNAFEANWFWAESPTGTVQGELWGTYEPQTLCESLAFTYLHGRIRLQVPDGGEFTLHPTDISVKPATFSVDSTAATDGTHMVSFTLSALAPDVLPLPGTNLPMVTQPFSLHQASVPQGTAQPVPARGEPAVFKGDETLLFNVVMDPVQTGLTYSCRETIGDTVVETGNVAFAATNATVLLQARDMGPYCLQILDGETVMGEAEFVVTGPVVQREVSRLDPEPFALETLVDIDCTDTGGVDACYAVTGRIRADQLPGGEGYLETYDPPAVTEWGGQWEWLSWPVDGLCPDEPHLLEITYPDIDDMLCGVNVIHPFLPPGTERDANGRPLITPDALHDYHGDRFGHRNSGVVPMSSGFVTGLGHPFTGTMHTLRAVFYPGDPWGLVHLWNYCRDQKPLRVARIKISRILNDVPRVNMPETAGGHHRFGHYDEGTREPIRHFASSAILNGDVGVYLNPRYDRYYTYYYIAAERLVKYLRFRGENTWFVGAHRYGNSYYPSAFERNGEMAGEKDALALYARMFEENGLTLVLSTAYAPGVELCLQDRYTDYDVAQGQPTLCQVTGAGVQAPTFSGRAGNYLDPRVCGGMEALAGELAERYDLYPAVRAIMYLAGLDGAFLPSVAAPRFYNKLDDPVDLDEAYFLASYDDLTIDRFTQETGIQVPGSPGDPARFAQRRDFLLDPDNKEAWIDFRCRQRLAVWQGIADAVHTAGSGRLDFYPVEYWHTAEYAFVRDAGSITQKVRNIGTDLALMSAEDSFAFGYYFNELNGYHESHQNGLPAPYRDALRDMNEDPTALPYIEENPNMGAYLGRQFLESRGLPCATNRPWYIDVQWGISKYPVPRGRGVLEDFALILSRCSPAYLVHCWVDVNLPAGQDAAYAEFASAYRTIPAGTYATFFRPPAAGAVVRERVPDEPGTGTVFYAVNTAQASRTLFIESAGVLEELTESASSPVPVPGEGYEIPLLPFALKVFTLEGGTLDGAAEIE
ncbi:MAG: LamG domain-containing protein [Lentisphaerae bacterium]|nr:LamG domain-containing protein [Lentisphaerota bacterium]